MSPLVVVGFLFLANGIASTHFELSELIQRIYQETDNSGTVVFFGVEDDFLHYFMRNRSNIPAAIFKRSPRENNEKIKCDWNAILVVQATGKNYSKVFQTTIAWLRVRKFVIISAESFKSLNQAILYFNVKKFTRIFGTAGGKTYAYLQYANDPVKQFSRKEPIPNSLRDLNGYLFRTIISPDMPRVFWYKDKSGNSKIGGYVGQLFVSFLQRHNATIFEVQMKDVDSRFMLAVLEATKNNSIDVSMNAYKPVKGLKMSYPFSLLNWNIIAPINGYVDPNQYFVRPFSPTVWVCIGLIIIYIVVMNALKEYCCNRPVSIWECFSEIYLTMMCLSTERPVQSNYRFHIQVLVFAFILSNLYLIHLTSFLTVFIKVKQYDVIQDLIDNKLPVMMIDYEWAAIEDPELHPKGFENIVTLVEREVMFRERNSMVNTSFGYAMGADKAEFYLGFQKRFARSMFRMIHDSLGDYYLGFLVADYSPFSEILSDCIIQIMDSGLMGKWMDDAVAQVRENGLLKMGTALPEKEIPFPLTMYHLNFAWNCLASGLVISAVIFFGEQIIARYVNSEIFQ